jgi:hypothetical protein
MPFALMAGQKEVREMKKVFGGLILAAGSVLAAPHVAFSVGVVFRLRPT